MFGFAGALVSVITISVSLSHPASSIFTCTNVTITNVQGMIASPSYPLKYLPNLHCTWTIKTYAESIISIRLWDLDIEKNTTASSSSSSSCSGNHSHSASKCCTDSWLQIGDRKFCGNLTKSTVISFATPTVQLSFVTGSAQNAGAGFMAIYSVRPEMRCKRSNMFLCQDTKSCYRNEDICDSVFQCADHSDEVNCGQCEDSLTRCNIYSSYCFDPELHRCNGLKECPKGEDERNCSSFPQKTHSNYPRAAYEFPDMQEQVEDEDQNNLFWIAIMFLGVAFAYLTLRWCLHRRDIRRLINQPPEFPLPPFRGPSEGAVEVECVLPEENMRYSEADFLQGGEIYEAFVRARRNIEEDRNERRHSLRHRNRCFDIPDPTDFDEFTFIGQSADSFLSTNPKDLLSLNYDGKDPEADPTEDLSESETEGVYSLPDELFKESGNDIDAANHGSSLDEILVEGPTTEVVDKYKILSCL